MAPSWIKMRVDLDVCPQVVRIASAFKADETRHVVRAAIVVGLLHKTWSLADGQTDDGFLPGYTRAVLDSVIGVPGWCELLESVDWMLVEAGGLRVPKWEEHNGTSAKRRSKEATRKADVRKKSASHADAAQPPSSSSSKSSSSSSSPSDSESERGTGGDPTPRAPRRAKHAKCTLDEQLAEVEFATLRSDIAEACHAWAAYRVESGNKPWGPATWRTRLREAVRAPEAFCAKVRYSIAQGYQGLFEDRPNGKANGKSTAVADLYAAGREAADLMGIDFHTGQPIQP